MRRIPLRPLAPVALLLVAACFARPDHPVAATGPYATPAPVVVGVPAAPVPEPAALAGAEAFDALFAGLEDAAGPLDWLAARASPPGQPPLLRILSRMERAVFARWRGGTPLGALEAVAAMGTSAHFPLPPRALADLLMSAPVERRALGADAFEVHRTDFRVPGHQRHVYRVELLNRGEAIFRYDFRVWIVMERWDLDDGTVLLRYDPLDVPRPEHITLYRGACRLVPADGGTALTEFLILGTDVSVPFFLQGKLRELSLDVFRRRLDVLWQLARTQAAAATRR